MVSTLGQPGLELSTPSPQDQLLCTGLRGYEDQGEVIHLHSPQSNCPPVLIVIGDFPWGKVCEVGVMLGLSKAMSSRGNQWKGKRTSPLLKRQDSGFHFPRL